MVSANQPTSAVRARNLQRPVWPTSSPTNNKPAFHLPPAKQQSQTRQVSLFTPKHGALKQPLNRRNQCFRIRLGIGRKAADDLAVAVDEDFFEIPQHFRARGRFDAVAA